MPHGLALALYLFLRAFGFGVFICQRCLVAPRCVNIVIASSCLDIHVDSIIALVITIIVAIVIGGCGGVVVASSSVGDKGMV